MKTCLKILLPVLLVLVLTFRGEAQIIRGGLIAGLNATQVDGDEVFGYKKYGWNLGATAIVPVTKKQWFVSLETIYNQKGSYQRTLYSDSSKSGAYKLNLNYVEVPVLLLFEDKGNMTFGMGASWGRLIKVDEWENGHKTLTNLNGPYNRDDFDVLLDVRFNLYKRIKFNFRYAYSMAKIRNRTYDNGVSTWDRKQYNNLLSFRVLYVFNEKVKAYENKKK